MAPSARASTRPGAGYLLLAFGALLLSVGSYIGLFVAPSESYMGDVYRILYVHVMYMSSPESAREEIKKGFERRVLDVMS